MKARACLLVISMAVSPFCVSCGGNSASELDADVADADDLPPVGEDAGVMECPVSGFEPNESKEEAAALQPGTCEDLRLETGDQDWYSVSVPKGTLATIGIEFTNKQGDLDLLAYDAAGKFLGARYMLENYSGYYRANETDQEFISVLANSEGPRTYLFKVRGFKNATNTYKLSLSFAPFQDGPDCSEIPSLESNCGTRFEFPYPDPDDGFIGSGYNFDTSDWDYAFFVFSNYRWLQLKVILAVRNAIYQVQQRFPGTNPLALGDMAQYDGKTPGADIGELRHPDGSHNKGLNIDLAYYQTGSTNDLQWICDADLDKYGESDEFCPTGLTHVVDLPRTAYFLMTLAQHKNFDVVGVDPAVEAALLAEAKRQTDTEGWFTSATYSKLKANVASGDGWPYHFDHMHVRFN